MIGEKHNTPNRFFSANSQLIYDKQLTPIMFKVLIFLIDRDYKKENQRLTKTYIANGINVSRNATARAVRDLQKIGYVHVHCGPHGNVYIALKYNLRVHDDLSMRIKSECKEIKNGAVKEWVKTTAVAYSKKTQNVSSNCTPKVHDTVSPKTEIKQDPLNNLHSKRATKPLHSAGAQLNKYTQPQFLGSSCSLVSKHKKMQPVKTLEYITNNNVMTRDRGIVIGGYDMNMRKSCVKSIGRNRSLGGLLMTKFGGLKMDQLKQSAETIFFEESAKTEDKKKEQKEVKGKFTDLIAHVEAAEKEREEKIRRPRV